ncbi:MAG: phosphoribosylanthranilate isomerase [Halobacteriota archaeon]
MFIKICGVKNFTELRMVEKCADATGVVVRAASRRAIGPGVAKEIISSAQIPVFVVSTENTLEGWMDIIRETGAECIQVHSDMGVQEFEKLREIFDGEIIKAFKVPQKCDCIEREVEVGKMMAKMSSYNPDYFLLDTGNGSGKLHDLRVSKEIVEKVKEKIILAGGLDPVNVSEIAGYVKPFGVDVSSGVERCNMKNEQLIKDFSEVFK